MAQLSPPESIEKGLQQLKEFSEKIEVELKKQCEILDDLELQNIKAQEFEKRTWSTNLLQNTRPFDKGFIKKPNFPNVFHKQKISKVAPTTESISTPTVTASGPPRFYRPRSPPYLPTD
jgi:hypothetical protein